MACKKCGSDWTTKDGSDCKTCPHCCKLQRCKARKEGRWVEPTQQKTCEECGVEFTAVGLHNIAMQVLCESPVCKAARHKRKRQASAKRRAAGVYTLSREPKPERHCQFSGCGKKLTRRNQKDYCGKPCYFAAIDAGQQQFKGRVQDEWARLVDWAYDWHAQRPRPKKLRQRKARPRCQHCGNECKQTASRFCCYGCVKAWRGIRKCELCGVDVRDSNAYSKCRCDSCKRLAKTKTNRRNKIKYGRNHRQRARRHGVRYVSVEVRAIYERDGWRCQICRRKCLHRFVVSKVDGRPHPRSPTIDHIRSMKRGGNHEPSNLQLACFSCNTKKGVACRGQLRLELV